MFGGGRQMWFASVLEVLDDGGEMELVARATETSEKHAFETVVGLDVGKTHLDPFSLVARLIELGCIFE